MHHLQIRRKGIRQPSSSKSSRRHFAITGDPDQILNKCHRYNLSQVINLAPGINDSNTFTAPTSGFGTQDAMLTVPIKFILFHAQVKLNAAQKCVRSKKNWVDVCVSTRSSLCYPVGHLQRNWLIQSRHLHLLFHPSGNEMTRLNIPVSVSLVIWNFSRSLNHSCLHMTRDWKG